MGVFGRVRNDPRIVTVGGHVGPDVIKDNTEQRIVEPALTDTAVGRRDVRAIPGPLVPAPRGGYSSSLEFPTADTFLATYVFDDPAVATIAANPGLGERLLSWQQVDAAGNRQGVTIAEFGELGGPGFGGCPNGPLQSGPPGPTGVTAATVTDGIRLTWTPAVAFPGTPAITGYRAHAVARTTIAQTTTGGEQVEIGRRITGQGATGTTITGLAPGETYDVEVVAVSSVGETFPAIHAVPQTDTTPPTVSASPAAGTFAVPQQVTLTADEPGSQIFFTTDGTDPVDAARLTPTATHFTTPLTIATDTTLRFVAFDPSGNASTVVTQQFTITNTPTPVAPTFGPSSTGPGTVTLSWSAADPSILEFGVQPYDGAGAKVGGLRTTAADVTTLTLTDLTPETPYFFTIAAGNANGYGPESAGIGPLTPQGAVVANAGPDQNVARGTAARTVLLDGSASTAGATYGWTQVLASPTDPDRVDLSDANTTRPSFTLPLYAFPMTNGPLTFRLTVTTAAGSRSDDVLVTPVPDQVGVTTARWRSGDFRVVGTGSLVGTTVTVHKGSPGGPVLGRAAVVAAAPPGVGDFTLRVRTTTGDLATNPGTIWIESSAGGTAGPFTVLR